MGEQPPLVLVRAWVALAQAQEAWVSELELVSARAQAVWVPVVSARALEPARVQAVAPVVSAQVASVWVGAVQAQVPEVLALVVLGQAVWAPPVAQAVVAQQALRS